MVIELCHNDWF